MGRREETESGVTNREVPHFRLQENVGSRTVVYGCVRLLFDCAKISLWLRTVKCHNWCVKLHLRRTRTKIQTYRRQESNLMQFSPKMWRLVAIILMIFQIINWPNFMHLLVDPGVFFHLPHLKFLWSIAPRPPVGWTPLRETTAERTNRQTDKRTCLFVRLCFRWSLTLCGEHARVSVWCLRYTLLLYSVDDMHDALELEINIRSCSSFWNISDVFSALSDFFYVFCWGCHAEIITVQYMTSNLKTITYSDLHMYC